MLRILVYDIMSNILVEEVDKNRFFFWRFVTGDEIVDEKFLFDKLSRKGRTPMVLLYYYQPDGDDDNDDEARSLYI